MTQDLLDREIAYARLGKKIKENKERFETYFKTSIQYVIQ